MSATTRILSANDRERLIPLGEEAVQWVQQYRNDMARGADDNEHVPDEMAVPEPIVERKEHDAQRVRQAAGEHQTPVFLRTRHQFRGQCIGLKKRIGGNFEL